MLHVASHPLPLGLAGVGQMAMIERLLSLGADMQAEDRPRPEDGPGSTCYFTPLQRAAYSGRKDSHAITV